MTVANTEYCGDQTSFKDVLACNLLYFGPKMGKALTDGVGIPRNGVPGVGDDAFLDMTTGSGSEGNIELELYNARIVHSARSKEAKLQERWVGAAVYGLGVSGR